MFFARHVVHRQFAQHLRCVFAIGERERVELPMKVIGALRSQLLDKLGHTPYPDANVIPYPLTTPSRPGGGQNENGLAVLRFWCLTPVAHTGGRVLIDLAKLSTQELFDLIYNAGTEYASRSDRPVGPPPNTFRLTHDGGYAICENGGKLAVALDSVFHGWTFFTFSRDQAAELLRLLSKVISENNLTTADVPDSAAIQAADDQTIRRN